MVTPNALFDRNLLIDFQLCHDYIAVRDACAFKDSASRNNEIMARVHKAIHQAYSWMVFPNEKKERNALYPIIADRLNARMKADAYQPESNITDPQNILRAADVLTAHAGYQNEYQMRIAIGDLPYNYDGLKRVSFSPEVGREWGVVAEVVITLLRLHHHGRRPPEGFAIKEPGIELAAHFVEETRDDANANNIRQKLWPRYLKVAHLVTAFQLWLHHTPHDEKEKNLYTHIFFHEWLSGSKAIKRELSKMTNKNLPNKLVFGSNAFIAIPSYAHVMADVKCDADVVKPFEMHEWKILAGYAARNRGK